MFEAAVATIGLRPVLCVASDTGPEAFPPQRRLGAVLPVARLEEAELAAYKTDLVLALAAHRPDALDLPAGAPGAASPSWGPAEQPVAGGVSEFFWTSWR